MADASLLEVADVETCYGLSQVLFGMSLAIAPGEMVTLMGRNGMGKTTTVRSIMGLTPATRGSIRFSGQEIRGLPAYQVAKLGIGLVPEGRQVFPNLTARENLVATAANRSGAREPWTLAKVCALFPRLSERIANMANQLSGGEQQMLAIGRALMTNPRLLILDEATEGLAPLIRLEIYRSIERLKEAGLSILIIDKDVKALIRVADVHYMLEKGRVVWTGSSDDLSRNEDIQHRYLGV
jgi:branched-chain amino acid transport system ATP-binding protein